MDMDIHRLIFCFNSLISCRDFKSVPDNKLKSVDGGGNFVVYNYSTGFEHLVKINGEPTTLFQGGYGSGLLSLDCFPLVSGENEIFFKPREYETDLRIKQSMWIQMLDGKNRVVNERIAKIDDSEIRRSYSINWTPKSLPIGKKISQIDREKMHNRAKFFLEAFASGDVGRLKRQISPNYKGSGFANYEKVFADFGSPTRQVDFNDDLELFCGDYCLLVAARIDDGGMRPNLLEFKKTSQK